MQRDERQRAAQPPPPGGWPAGSPSPSSPQGLETRSRKRARTDSAPSPSADSNLGTVVDAQRAPRRVTADSCQHTTSTYRTWLHGIDPRTAGAPAYTSYLGAKVAQHFETGWGVGVVCCPPRSPKYRWSPQMAMWPNPCVRVCVSVSRVPAGRMERESLPATRRVWVAAPLSVLRPIKIRT
jgi:hypothetical protein